MEPGVQMVPHTRLVRRAGLSFTALLQLALMDGVERSSMQLAKLQASHLIILSFTWRDS